MEKQSKRVYTTVKYIQAFIVVIILWAFALWGYDSVFGLSNDQTKINTTTEWEITHYCIHDASDYCLGDVYVEPFIAKVDTTQGFVLLESKTILEYALLEQIYYKAGYNPMTEDDYIVRVYEALDKNMGECQVLIATFIDAKDRIGIQIGVRYEDGIFYWTGQKKYEGIEV